MNNIYKTIAKTANEGQVIDTKLVQTRDGFIYHISRKRLGLMDTISISYGMCAGIKTREGRIFAPLGWIAQKSAEIAIDLM